MLPAGPGIRVRVYMAESDLREGRPLYAVMLERLRLAGARGACALNGLTGFGRASVDDSHPLRMSRDIPIVVEVVDEPSREQFILSAIRELTRDHLVTIERVGIVP